MRICRTSSLTCKRQVPNETLSGCERVEKQIRQLQEARLRNDSLKSYSQHVGGRVLHGLGAAGFRASCGATAAGFGEGAAKLADVFGRLCGPPLQHARSNQQV